LEAGCCRRTAEKCQAGAKVFHQQQWQEASYPGPNSWLRYQPIVADSVKGMHHIKSVNKFIKNTRGGFKTSHNAMKVCLKLVAIIICDSSRAQGLIELGVNSPGTSTHVKDQVAVWSRRLLSGLVYCVAVSCQLSK